MTLKTRNHRQLSDSRTLHRLLACALALFVITGCRSDDLDMALPKARAIFREVITDFQSQNNKTKVELEQGKSTFITFGEALREAQDKDAEFAKVYTKWRRVETEVKKIHSEFENLVKGADHFFDTIEERANSISDNQARERSLTRLNESKEKYIIQLKQAKAGINKLDDVTTAVRDTMTELEINYSLEIVDDKISETVKEIDSMIESTMEQLDELLIESNSLLGLKFG